MIDGKVRVLGRRIPKEWRWKLKKWSVRKAIGKRTERLIRSDHFPNRENGGNCELRHLGLV